MNKWRLIEDGAPKDKDAAYLVLLDGDFPTHWMPLPEPPDAA